MVKIVIDYHHEKADNTCIETKHTRENIMTTATKLNIKQRTHNFDGEKETIFTVNGCNIIYCVFQSDGRNWGYKVISFAGDDNAKVVYTGSSWADIRRKARKLAPELYAKHAAKHGLTK